MRGSTLCMPEVRGGKISSSRSRCNSGYIWTFSDGGKSLADRASRLTPQPPRIERGETEQEKLEREHIAVTYPALYKLPPHPESDLPPASGRSTRASV